MFSFLKCLLLVAAAAKLAAAASCDRDNLLRCFIASPEPASAFCSSYSAPSTITVIVTPTSTATATSTTTTSSTTTTTQSRTTTTRETSVSTRTITDYRLIVSTITTTKFGEPPNPGVVSNRGLQARATDPPSCVTHDGTTSTSYPPSRINSACACIGVAPGTTSVTVTASATTTTVTVPATASRVISVTVSTTTTVTITTTKRPSTLIISTSSTTTITSPLYGCGTVTATVSSSPTQAVEFNEIYGGEGRYYACYRDPACRTVPDAQQHFAPDTFCEAVQQCADYSANLTLGYYTFTVYAFGGNRNYECHTYYGGPFNYLDYSDQDGYISFAVEYSHGGPYKK